MPQELFPRGHGHTPVQFVKDGVPVTAQIEVDLTKGDEYKPKKGYVPTARVVACVPCQLAGRKTIGTLDFPQGFSEKTGDRIMDSKPVDAFCPRCNKVVEMRPLSPKEVKQSMGAIVERYTEIYEDHIVHKKCPVVNPGEVIQKVLEQHLNPPQNAGGGKIIVEE
jgi:hypothetical protein